MSDRFATFRAPHPLLLFVAMFIVTLTVQWMTWQRVHSFDEEHWVHAAKVFSQGELIATDHFVYGYPGTTVLGVAAGFITLGVDDVSSLRLSMALLFSFAGATIVVLAYLLRPQLPWWPVLAWALILQQAAYFATPPSSVLGPLLTLFTLLTLYAIERKNYSLPMLALIGASAALAAATRLDIAGIITGCGILALSLIARSFRVFFLTSLIGLLVFVAINPFMWQDAFGHVAATADKIFAHADIEEGSTGALHSMFKGSVFGSLSFVLIIAALIFKLPLTLQKGFVLFLVCAWSAVIGALFISSHHPAWIFYPALLTLELLFPLFVISLIPIIAKRFSINSIALGAFLLGVFLTYYLIRYQLFSH